MNNIRVGVLGLGYVGLTLSTVLASIGYIVIGSEKKKDIVELTNLGKPHFSENGLDDILKSVTNSKNLIAKSEITVEDDCSIFIITVGTPLSDNGEARLDFIEHASKQVANVMKDGSLVILRSTVKIGTSRNVVKAILDMSGKHYKLAMCPERTLEGRALKELRELPQIVGADDEDSRNSAYEFFSTVTKSVVLLTKLEAAEILKLVDNTYRDIQFGFANEVAEICEIFGVSAEEVISSGKLGYPRTNVALPGLVGGPCLEKDPHILAQSVQTFGHQIRISPAAREVNETQPKTTVMTIGKIANSLGITGKAEVAILGIAFKGIPETDDIRGSMSIKVLDEILNQYPSWNVTLFDPVINTDKLKKSFPSCSVENHLETSIKNKNIVIICNNHSKFSELRPQAIYEIMAEKGFIYDYWNHYSKHNQIELNNKYFAVGNLNKGNNYG